MLTWVNWLTWIDLKYGCVIPCLLDWLTGCWCMIDKLIDWLDAWLLETRLEQTAWLDVEERPGLGHLICQIICHAATRAFWRGIAVFQASLTCHTALMTPDDVMWSCLRSLAVMQLTNLLRLDVDSWFSVHFNVVKSFFFLLHFIGFNTRCDFPNECTVWQVR